MALLNKIQILQIVFRGIKKGRSCDEKNSKVHAQFLVLSTNSCRAISGTKKVSFLRI